MRVILEFDLDAERSLYDDVLALQKYYKRENGLVMLTGRKLTPSEQIMFSCEPGSAVERYKATALLKIWEDEAEKEGKLKSVLEDLVKWLHELEEGPYVINAHSVRCVLTKSCFKRKVDVKIDGLEGDYLFNNHEK